MGTNTCKIGVPENTDIGAAMGAARLAMLADGHSLAHICTPPRLSHIIDPDPALAASLQPGYQFSQTLYPLMTKK